jgi:hypothetical protein
MSDFSLPLIEPNPMPRLPMPPTNNEAYKKNTKEQYEALGRFVEKFELMVNKVWPAPGLDDTRLS